MYLNLKPTLLYHLLLSDKIRKQKDSRKNQLSFFMFMIMLVKKDQTDPGSLLSPRRKQNHLQTFREHPNLHTPQQ